MSDSYKTVADLATINDRNARDLGVTDLFNAAPVLARLAATTASNGTSHKYVKETGAPVVGFRAANAGRENSKSTDELVTIDLKILDASFGCDDSVASVYRGGREAYVGREGERHLRAAFFAAERQIFNSASDVTGFEGLDAALNDPEMDMVVDAGGTTVNGAFSLWAIRTGGDERDAVFVIGEDGEITVGETVSQRFTDADGKHYPGLYTPITGWTGLQIGGARSIGRICNLTTQDGHTLTDDLIAELLSRFPAGFGPTFLATTRRGVAQLRKSRTATNPTGQPAPFPVEAFNIPLITTDAISLTEAIVEGD